MDFLVNHKKEGLKWDYFLAIGIKEKERLKKN